MKILVRKLPLGGYEKSTDGETWEAIDFEEYKKLMDDGAEETSVSDAEVDVKIDFEDGRTLEHIYLKDNKLQLKFVGKDIIEVEDEYAPLIYDSLIKALATNKTGFVEREIVRLAPAEAEKVDEPAPEETKPVEEDASEEDEKPEELHEPTEPETDPVEDKPEEEDEDKKFKNITELTGFIMDKSNTIDSGILSRFDGDPALKSLGEENYQVLETSVPLRDDSTIKCRVLVGFKEGSENEVFVALPDNWGSISKIENDDEIDLEEANNDFNVDVVLSEDTVLTNSDKFYEDVGEAFFEGSGYSQEAAAPEEPSLDTPPEETPDESDPGAIDEPAIVTKDEITPEDGSAVIPFESAQVPYIPRSKEKWLTEFTATDDFDNKVKRFVEAISSGIRPSLMRHVRVHIGENKKFIALRISKQAIKESSTDSVWFKKRLTKVCETIKREAAVDKELKIVETYGDYYTRTFILVENIRENFCIYASDDIEEINLTDSIYEGKKVEMSEEFKAKITEAFNSATKPILRPVFMSKSKAISETFKVENMGLTPYFVTLGEEKKIVFLDKVEGLAEVVETPKVEATQAADIAPVVKPMIDINDLKKGQYWDEWFKDPERYTDNATGYIIDNCVATVGCEGKEIARAVLCECFGGKMVLAPHGFLESTGLGRGLNDGRNNCEILDSCGREVRLNNAVTGALSRLFATK